MYLSLSCHVNNDRVVLSLFNKHRAALISRQKLLEIDFALFLPKRWIRLKRMLNTLRKGIMSAME